VAVGGECVWNYYLWEMRHHVVLTFNIIVNIITVVFDGPPPPFIELPPSNESILSFL